MQALTKYPSGGADVLMGSVCTNNDTLWQALNHAHISLGYGVSGNDAEAVLRGLPSIELRYEAQGKAALQLARWMQSRPEVGQVWHPALPESPGHEHWKVLVEPVAGMVQVGGACLFSVLFKPCYSREQVQAFVDRLQLFGIGYSWAGPMSLAVPYRMKHSRSLGWPDQHAALVRFAIGLESVADLQNDLAQALAGMREGLA
jgi:cystathionine beta-lyase